MNHNGELTETDNVIFYVSYGVLTEYSRMNVILTCFATEMDTATDTWRWKQGISFTPRYCTAAAARCRSQWSSEARLAAAREVPGSNRAAADKSFCVFHRKSPRYADLSTGCTLTAVPWSTKPSTLWGTVNEYQPYGWVIIPMADSRSSCSLAYELAATWHGPTFVQITQSELSHSPGAV